MRLTLKYNTILTVTLVFCIVSFLLALHYDYQFFAGVMFANTIVTLFTKAKGETEEAVNGDIRYLMDRVKMLSDWNSKLREENVQLKSDTEAIMRKYNDAIESLRK